MPLNRVLRRRWPAILGLLALGSPALAAFHPGAGGVGELRDEADTLRVLAIRVEFQADTLDTTTGDGRFESAFRFEEPWIVDPLPHDSLYFADQLSFLAHYYGRVSNGRLAIESEVWPRGARTAYRLEHPMWHYNWNQSRERGDAQLALLFQDAWQAADADSALEFFGEDGLPRFDAYIVFHAGVGQDFGEDRTPHDIPSAYLLSDDLVGEELDRQGAVDVADPARVRPDGSVYAGGSGSVEQGLILPEGENHEDFQHGMAGVVVLQFGHVIGLPNLYDGTTGRSVIGKWGLMDQGSANFSGLLPALPSAWIRLLMGWDDALVVDADRDSLYLARLGLDSELPRILKIPLAEKEYLLVENRERDAGDRGFTWGRDRAGRWLRLGDDYSIELADTLGQSGDSVGVLVEVGDLDFDLPGSGLLVWHVDERRTTAELVRTNAVNNDPARRGVDLEEADGIQDIGEEYPFFSARSSVALGGADDAWRDGNGSWGIVNDHLSYNRPEYSWRSQPSSDTNDGLVTGLRLHGFGPAGDSMLVSVSFDLRPAFHGARLAPALDEALGDTLDVQLFDFDGGAVFSLLAGGEAWSLALEEGAPVLHERGDGFLSLLPPAWSSGLDGLRAIQLSDGPALLAWRGSDLALFRLSEAGGFELDVQQGFGQTIRDLTAAPAPGDDWGTGEASVHAAVGTTLLRLDPESLLIDAELPVQIPAGHLRLIALGNVNRRPGWLLDGEQDLVSMGGSVFQRPPQVDDLFAIDDLSMPGEAPGAPQRVSALLRDPLGASLYEGQTLLQRIDCANVAVRPLQAGDGSGLEIAMLTPSGEIRVYNPLGVEIASARTALPAADAVGADWLTGSRGDGRPVHWIASGETITALEIDGTPAASWPRTMPANVVGGLHGLPGGQWLVALTRDGRVHAWEADLDGLVWAGPRGDGNGGGRPASTGDGESAAPAEVLANDAFVWPNPAGEVAHFRFRLDGPARVTLSVFDVAGERRHLQSQEFATGAPADGEIVWRTTDVAPGGYFCVLEAVPADGGPGWTKRIKCAVLR